MLWRCWASFEHGIAHLGPHALQVRSYSASGLADLTPRVLTSAKFLPTQGIVAAACVNPRFVAESDYPHSEPTFPQSPKILAEIRAGVPDDEQAKIAGGNTARVYHFDVARLTLPA